MFFFFNSDNLYMVSNKLQFYITGKHSFRSSILLLKRKKKKARRLPNHKTPKFWIFHFFLPHGSRSMDRFRAGSRFKSILFKSSVRSTHNMVQQVSNLDANLHFEVWKYGFHNVRGKTPSNANFG